MFSHWRPESMPFVSYMNFGFVPASVWSGSLLWHQLFWEWLQTLRFSGLGFWSWPNSRGLFKIYNWVDRFQTVWKLFLLYSVSTRFMSSEGSLCSSALVFYGLRICLSLLALLRSSENSFTVSCEIQQRLIFSLHVIYCLGLCCLRTGLPLIQLFYHVPPQW